MLKNLSPILVLLLFNFCFAEGLVHSAELKVNINAIAIDPGFGGNEHGPSGCDGNEMAKDLNLRIAKKVAEKIKNDLGLKVIMTRDTDKDICLDERLSVAYSNKANLFISIHTNGTDNPSVAGIEAYFLNLASDPEEISKAAKENAADPGNVPQLESILSDLMLNARIHESELLARNVQTSLFKHLKQKNKKLVNRGVKQAPFYLLIGSNMPAILIETGFITNPIECIFLRSDEYQDEISIGIVEGIRTYMNNR